MLKVQNQHIHLASGKSELDSFSNKISAIACFIEAEQKMSINFRIKYGGVPGGKLEAAETPIEAAVPELQREKELIEFLYPGYIKKLACLVRNVRSWHVMLPASGGGPIRFSSGRENFGILWSTSKQE